MMLSLVVGVVLILIAGCSSSKKSTSSAGSSSATSSAATTTSGSASATSSAGASQTVKIGINDATGTPYNNSPERIAAVKAAVQALNAAGGSKKYEVDYCNDGNTVNTGLACARQFIKDKVVACVGCESDFANAQVATLLAGAGIPMIEDEAETPVEFNGANMFLLSGGAQFQSAGAAAQAAALGLKKFFFVGIDLPGTLPYRDVVKQVGTKLGMTDAGSLLLPLNVANYDSYAAKVKATGADAVIEIMSPQWYIPMTNAMTSQGFKPKIFLNGDVPRPADFLQLGEASSRTYVAADILPPSSADTNKDIATFVAEMKAYQTATNDKGADLQTMRLSAVRAWLAMKFVAQLAEPMQDVTAATLTAALKAAKGLTSTMIPPWTPDATGCVKGFSRVSNPFVFYLAVENNQMVAKDPTPVDMTKYLC